MSEHGKTKLRRREVTAQEAGLDSDFRQRVVDVMSTVLANLLDRTDPVTENMRLMEELGLSSTLGLELLLQLEDQLEILIDVELLDQDQMRTVGDMATFVAGHSRPA
jgi:acyl carrier protein